MNNTPEQLIKTLHAVTMTDQERTTMRHTLSVAINSSALRPTWWGMLSSTMARHAVASYAVALVIAGTAVSGLAQQALPGDVLYPVKTGINDRVRYELTLDDDARLDLELEQIGDNLSEEQQAADRELTL
jgi:hypothetical protein